MVIVLAKKALCICHKSLIYHIEVILHKSSFLITHFRTLLHIHSFPPNVPPLTMEFQIWSRRCKQKSTNWFHVRGCVYCWMQLIISVKYLILKELRQHLWKREYNATWWKHTYTYTLIYVFKLGFSLSVSALAYPRSPICFCSHNTW